MQKIKISYKDVEISVYVDPENAGVIQRTWIAGNFYETARNGLLPYLERFFIDRIKDKNVIDVGANIGNHSLFFAKVCGANQVFAIEAAADKFQHLIKNIKTTRTSKKIKPFEIAISGKAETGSIVNYSWKAGPGKEKSISLDEFTADKENIGLVKIDIEGGELAALQGSKNLLVTQKPLIAAEAMTMDEYKEINKYLSGFGYEVVRIEGKPFAFNATPTYIWK